MTSRPTVLLVPGYTNSGPQHWQSLWQRAHPEYRRVEQDDWDAPDVASWVSALDREVRAAPSPVVLVAHSLGCITIAHWSARTPYAASRVVAALLVAPADVERADAPDVLKPFGPIPLGPLPFRTVVVASTTDETVALDRAQRFAAAWNAEFVNVGDAGHINTAAGFGAWLGGERLLDSMLEDHATHFNLQSRSERDSLVYEITNSEYSPRIDVCAATPDDLDPIMGIVHACIDRMRADAIDQWDEVYPNRTSFEQDLTEGTLWVAREGETCRGVMVLNERQDAEYNTVPWRYRHGPILVVHRLAVDPAVQGRRIASQLMDFAEAYAETHAFAAIRLDAFGDSSRAVRLYKKRDYRIAGEVRFRKGIFKLFEKCIAGC